MTITQDYQVELPDENLLLGCNTDYDIRRDDSKDIEGITGTPPVKLYDIESVGLDGSAPGMDAYQVRQITIPVRVFDMDPAQARSKLQTLLDAWQLVRRGTTPLDIRVPGTPETVMRYWGRPREVAENRIFRKGGLIEVNLTFDAVDPRAYGAEVDSDVTLIDDSPLTVINTGSTTSSRATLIVEGNGGMPHITNTSDPDQGDIVFKHTLLFGESLTINLFDQTVIHSVLNLPWDRNVWISSLWFGLLPGNNEIEFTNCASLQVADARPAWP